MAQRHLDDDLRKSIIEVVAEALRVHLGVQVAPGSGYHTHIDGQVARRPNGLSLLR